ncbi:hypothetical protein N7509_004182 [Penicillium cosmopolitanum]|uniref:Uncharacterized protein n=1 Tax=Penicillium cosmopolitanum TaxID=1131564 RepID=A0A9W9W6J4_9EURO|nr:uncharacterized protein N7509_004182 [Penicillium cosmopolitanum]KAJ5404311.1 hypothetical protein N7509_004182 [Penicillium cosmopolitanum]
MKDMLADSVDENELCKIDSQTNKDETDMENDIARFLNPAFTQIVEGKENEGLYQGWPGDDRICDIADKFGGLLIYAATVCRFLGGLKPSKVILESRLQKIFDGKVSGRSPQASLVAIYSRIQSAMMEGLDVDEEEDIISRFRLVVGSIIIVLGPPTFEILSKLIEIPESDIRGDLKGLHSVLFFKNSPMSTIQLLHLTFRDYLLDERRLPIAWSSDSKVIAFPDYSHMTIWNFSKEVLAQSLDATSLELLALAFSPGDQLLAAMANFGTLLLFQPGSSGDTKYYKIADWSPQVKPTMRDFEPPVLEFSKDGKTIQTGYGRIDVRIFKGELNHSDDLSLYIDGAWILRGRQRVMMIPHEYRVSCAFAADDTLFMGFESGGSGSITFDGTRKITHGG